MEFEKQNKLSEGVGKRIIDALKTNRSHPEYISEFNTQYQEPEYKEYNYNSDEKYINHTDYREQKNGNIKDNTVSSNIDTLVELVSKLPPGVTKQTGAQIIRSTMEAAGISMNKVLANAQMVQEELEQGIKNNINVIEDYRLKIKTLDSEIQQFRKKAHDLEDIISLFILSDNKK